MWQVLDSLPSSSAGTKSLQHSPRAEQPSLPALPAATDDLFYYHLKCKQKCKGPPVHPRIAWESITRKQLPGRNSNCQHLLQVTGAQWPQEGWQGQQPWAPAVSRH